ncbi:EamA family transporter [Paenibacillus sonchi]|nr:EamA family transporter [Paenibacillus sonchi]
MINILLVLSMTLIGSFGGYFFKLSTTQSIGLHKTFIVNLLIGGFLYLIGAYLNVLLLKRVPYTIGYPLTSITYIWTMILSKWLLKENITSKKIIGVCLIIFGALILAN